MAAIGGAVAGAVVAAVGLMVYVWRRNRAEDKDGSSKVKPKSATSKVVTEAETLYGTSPLPRPQEGQREQARAQEHKPEHHPAYAFATPLEGPSLRKQSVVKPAVPTLPLGAPTVTSGEIPALTDTARSTARKAVLPPILHSPRSGSPHYDPYANLVSRREVLTSREPLPQVSSRRPDMQELRLMNVSEKGMTDMSAVNTVSATGEPAAADARAARVDAVIRRRSLNLPAPVAADPVVALDTGAVLSPGADEDRTASLSNILELTHSARRRLSDESRSRTSDSAAAERDRPQSPFVPMGLDE